MVHNTLDAAAPTSQVGPLPATTTDYDFPDLLVGPGRGERLGDRRLRPVCLGRRRRILPASDRHDRYLDELHRSTRPHVCVLQSSPATTSAMSRTPPARPDATTTILVTTTVNAGPDQTANEGAVVGLPGGTYTSPDDPSHLNLTHRLGRRIERGRYAGSRHQRRNDRQYPPLCRQRLVHRSR